MSNELEARKEALRRELAETEKWMDRLSEEMEDEPPEEDEEDE